MLIIMALINVHTAPANVPGTDDKMDVLIFDDCQDIQMDVINLDNDVGIDLKTNKAMSLNSPNPVTIQAPGSRTVRTSHLISWQTNKQIIEPTETTTTNCTAGKSRLKRGTAKRHLFDFSTRGGSINSSNLQFRSIRYLKSSNMQFRVEYNSKTSNLIGIV
jgi:hypothetical protein